MRQNRHDTLAESRFWGHFGLKTALARIMLKIDDVMLKSSNNSPVAVRCEMSEPTKFIMRCCELRKLRMRQTLRVPERQQPRDPSRN